MCSFWIVPQEAKTAGRKHEEPALAAMIGSAQAAVSASRVSACDQAKSMRGDVHGSATFHASWVLAALPLTGFKDLDPGRPRVERIPPAWLKAELRCAVGMVTPPRSGYTAWCVSGNSLALRTLAEVGLTKERLMRQKEELKSYPEPGFSCKIEMDHTAPI